MSITNKTRQLVTRPELHHDSFYCTSENALFFDEMSNPRRETDDEFVLAKKTIRPDKSIKYQIKTDKHRKLINPNNIGYAESANKDIDRIKKNTNYFISVDYKTFNFYISFLKTSNISWLRQAERELG